MARQALEWPSHGNAVNARNDTAEILNEIEHEAATMFELAGTGKLIRDEALLRLGRIVRLANHAVRLMENEGAPTRPRID